MEKEEPMTETREISDEPPAGLVNAQRLAIKVAETVAYNTTPGEVERDVRDRADALVLELGGTGVWTPTTVGFGSARSVAFRLTSRALSGFCGTSTSE